MQEASISRILIGIDGSEGALRAARYARAIARHLPAQVTLLHVATITVPFSGVERNPEVARRAEEASRVYGEQALADAEQIFAGVTPVDKKLIFGDPASVICEVARADAFDLVVVSSRGLGTVDRLLLGSVSSAVVNHAPCPVLVVRKRDADTAT